MLARHAESLFWAGREIERAESTARMLDVTYHGLLEAMPWEAERSWMDLLKVLWLDRPFAELEMSVRAATVSEFLVFDPDNPGAILSSVGQARENARAARELISSELWEALNSFHLELRARNLRADVEARPHELYGFIKRSCQMIAGVAGETMPRDDGWRFFMLGWMLERAEMTCRLLDVRYSQLVTAGAKGGFHHWLQTLKSASGSEAFRRRYRASMDPADVVEFLLLSRTFPRSVLYSLQAGGERPGPPRGGQHQPGPPAAPARAHPVRPRVPRHPGAARGRPPRLPRPAPQRRAPGGRGRGPPVLPQRPGARPPRARALRARGGGGLTVGVTRYDVRYRTNIHYDDVVRASQNEMRACPASDEHQQLVAYRVTTHPASRVLSYQDYFGTRVDTFGVREPHVALEISAEASVETLPRPLVTVSPRLEELRTAGLPRRARRVPRADRATRPGTRTSRRRPQRIAAVTGDDVVGIVLALHRFVHTSLRYTPGATYIGVDVNEVLAKAQGVCQDYAHLAVALVPQRRHPRPLRVGLLLRRLRADRGRGRPGDEVTVQTHAWFEAAIPGWGWLALDPTNALQVGQRHIAIGHGRDYDDVPPGAGHLHRRRSSLDGGLRRDPPAERRGPAAPGPAVTAAYAR